MDSDSDKENYFSLYMKKIKNDTQKKIDIRSDKKAKNNCCASIQKLKEDHNKKIKLLLESSEKKNKNTFSIINSNLFKIHAPDKNKKECATGTKNLFIDKMKSKNIRVNKSSADINSYSNKNKKSKNNKKHNIDIKNNNKCSINHDNKIDKLKNRIFDLMNVIDNFEKDYINSNKPIQIKEEDKVTKIKIIIDYQVKSFKGLFSWCKYIESINFKKFYRNNITDMSWMFNGCYSLKKLNLNNFNTKK